MTLIPNRPRTPVLPAALVITLAAALAVALGGCATAPPVLDPFEPKPATPGGIDCTLLQAGRCAYKLPATDPRRVYDLLDGTCTGLAAGSRIWAIQSAWRPDAAVVVHSPKTTLVAFRGTVPPKAADSDQVKRDWLNNMNAKPVDEPGLGRVHHGFQMSLDSIWTHLTERLKSLRGSKEGLGDLYLTGHSKGGAMAVLAAARLARDGMVPKGVTTYAAPRVGADGFADAYAALGIPTVRYENQGDLVPHLPPSPAELSLIRTSRLPAMNRLVSEANFGPTGTLRYIVPDGTVVTDPPKDGPFPKARLQALRHEISGKLPREVFRLLAVRHSCNPGEAPGEGGYYITACGATP